MAMNFFRKRSKQEAVGNDWKASGSFVRKPVKGWLHSDRLLESSGVTYEAKVLIFIVIINYFFQTCNKLCINIRL